MEAVKIKELAVVKRSIGKMLKTAEKQNMYVSVSICRFMKASGKFQHAETAI
jgi:hypothetical protein